MTQAKALVFCNRHLSVQNHDAEITACTATCTNFEQQSLAKREKMSNMSLSSNQKPDFLTSPFCAKFPLKSPSLLSLCNLG